MYKILKNVLTLHIKCNIKKGGREGGWGQEKEKVIEINSYERFT